MPTSLTQSTIYDEIGELCEFMPENFRHLFCFRWGLQGRSPHTLKQTARRFQLTTGSADSRLQRCLSNIARHARHHDMPALGTLLGDDPGQWPRCAWEQADRWGNQESQFGEAVMLVALAGVDVTEARGAVREHMINLGLARTNRWTPPLKPAERVAAAHGPVTQILDHVLWPRTLTRPSELTGFQNLRPLERFASAKTGAFHSEKHGLIEYSSDLERVILRHLAVDTRIHSLREQPLRIPYVLDGQPHDYYPDAIVRLHDGRVFVMEIKPPENLGEFDGWLKWATLARYCATRGYGLYVGSPKRSIIDHYRIAPDTEAREFINAVIREGAVTGQEYKALLSLVGPEELGLTATADNLDWRTNRSRVRHAQGADHDEARRFWRLVGMCADKRRADQSSEANPASVGGNN